MSIRLELKKDAQGRLRPNWYGIHEANGKRRVATLNRWKGTPPASMSSREPGDTAFESSRQAAREMAGKVFEPDQNAAEREALTRNFYRARYRQDISVHKLEDLPALWNRLPKKRQPGANHAENMKRNLGRFVAFMSERCPAVKELGAITGDQLRAYVDALPGIAGDARSCNEHLNVLRRVFRHAAPASVGAAVLNDLPGFQVESVHREPFTPDQLKTVFDAADGDELLRPLVVCAACTAMRRKDVALLKWGAVDMTGGFLTVKAAKTGATCDIPIFPMLRAELEAALPGKRKPDPAAHIWPDAANLYLRDPDALDRRLKKILKAAGFVDPTKAKAAQDALPILPAAEVRARGLAAIEKAKGWSAKRRDRARKVFTAYMDGATIPEIAERMKMSRGIVSLRLGEVAKRINAQVIRRPALPAVIHGATIAEGGEGPRKKRASLRGWHSFKTTWITLALSAGVPMELVCRVTGNKSVDIVLKHYFKPGREAMKDAFLKSMPRLLVEGKEGPRAIASADIRRLADQLNARTLKDVKKQLLALAAEA